MRTRGLMVVAGILVGASCATQPRLPRTDVANVPEVAVPSAEHPEAFNYLTQVMRYAGSAEELAVYRGWAALPLEEVRETLEWMGIIRDREAPGQTWSQLDKGWAGAVNGRYHLLYSYLYETAAGRRRALIFMPGQGGGSGGNTERAWALLTDEAYRPLKRVRVQVFQHGLPVDEHVVAKGDGLEVTFDYKYQVAKAARWERLRFNFGAETVREEREPMVPRGRGGRVIVGAETGSELEK